MTPHELPDLTPLLYGLGKLVVVVLVLALVFLGVAAWAKSAWRNRSTAAPREARGGKLEPVAAVFNGRSTVWDEQLSATGLFIRRAGKLERPRVVSASRSVLVVTPPVGTMPAWYSRDAAVHLSQIANHPLAFRQLGNRVEIRLVSV